MGLFGDVVDQAIAALPPKKDPHGKTCRSMVYDAIGQAAYASIGGGPWEVEVEVALHNLCLAVDRAIDGDAVLKEIFDSPQEPPFGSEETLRKDAAGNTERQFANTIHPAIEGLLGAKTDKDPTVTLIISTSGALIGCAPFGAAVTERNTALSNEVRKLLRKYGYSQCDLVLDANENIERHEAPVGAA
jgi:hypothetical protein